MPIRRHILVLLCSAVLFACATPEKQSSRDRLFKAPVLTDNRLLTRDGTSLPVMMWRPKAAIKAIVIAIHGMNDYAESFRLAGPAWAKAGVLTYAFDQRGFGRTPNAGLWAGAAPMAQDVRTLAHLVSQRHPGVPVFLVGVSMGGAVAILAAGTDGTYLPKGVKGIVLVAPAVWSRRSMPLLYQTSLWLAAHSLPAYRLTGQGLNRQPSDNIAELRRMGRDPYVQKGARVDMVWGVVGLMDKADGAMKKLRLPVLLLYGKKDQIIPEKPTLRALARIRPAARRFAYYRNGWHMLLRDKQRALVYRDILSWMADPTAALPSGADRAGQALLEKKTGVKTR